MTNQIEKLTFNLFSKIPNVLHHTIQAKTLNCDLFNMEKK